MFETNLISRMKNLATLGVPIHLKFIVVNKEVPLKKDFVGEVSLLAAVCKVNFDA